MKSKAKNINRYYVFGKRRWTDGQWRDTSQNEECLCGTCNEPYIPRARNQKNCPECIKYGSKALKLMAEQIMQYRARLKKELNSTVIFLDPVAYAQGIRREIDRTRPPE